MEHMVGDKLIPSEKLVNHLAGRPYMDDFVLGLYKNARFIELVSYSVEEGWNISADSIGVIGLVPDSIIREMESYDLCSEISGSCI